MFSQLDQQLKNFDELAASVSSVFDCSEAVIKDACELPSNDQLEIFEEVKLLLESCVKIQEDLKAFRDSFANAKNQMLSRNTAVTEDNMLSLLESHIASNATGSSILPEQAQLLNKVDQHINFIKASRALVVEEEKVVAAVIEEEEITVTEHFGKMLDPLTRRKMENPVKNRVCGHIYEKSTIVEYLKSNKVRKCPYAGCANKELRMGDIFDAVHIKTP